ncbi:hypothetical protein V1477_016410 [Vespula maculifrons]|uniref:Uncharacterized protein n=1 Tax=Vespula maculifrons TaxID=7453 RepID=A0ABD2BCX1_VESMC
MMMMMMIMTTTTTTTTATTTATATVAAMMSRRTLANTCSTNSDNTLISDRVVRQCLTRLILSGGTDDSRDVECQVSRLDASVIGRHRVATFVRSHDGPGKDDDDDNDDDDDDDDDGDDDDDDEEVNDDDDDDDDWNNVCIHVHVYVVGVQAACITRHREDLQKVGEGSADAAVSTSGSNSSGVSGKRVRADILPLWHYASLSFCKASKRKLNRGLGWNKSERCLWVVPCQVHWLLFALNFQLYSLSLKFFTHNANWREARYHVQNGGKQPGNIEDISNTSRFFRDSRFVAMRNNASIVRKREEEEEEIEEEEEEDEEKDEYERKT